MSGKARTGSTARVVLQRGDELLPCLTLSELRSVDEDIVIRLRRIYCCKGAEFCRPELEAAWKEINQLRADLLRLLKVIHDYEHTDGTEEDGGTTFQRYWEVWGELEEKYREARKP